MISDDWFEGYNEGVEFMLKKIKKMIDSPQTVSKESGTYASTVESLTSTEDTSVKEILTKVEANLLFPFEGILTDGKELERPKILDAQRTAFNKIVNESCAKEGESG